MSKHANDTAMIFGGSEKSLQTWMSELKWFYYVSGLNINQWKTQVVRYGKKYSNYKKCQEIEIIWTTTFKHIGIKYDAYLLKIIKMNYD